MSLYRLDRLFRAKSVAVVGARPRPGSLGRIVLHNLKSAGFRGTIRLVSAGQRDIDGVPAVARLADLDAAPDVIVVTVPPDSVPGVIAEAAETGVAAAIVLSAGLGHGPGSLAQAAGDIARAAGLRIVGPNCLGVIVPRIGLNASFAARMPARGDLALISQSGAIAAGMIDWAAGRRVGFSAIVSIGDQLDVDVADLLDYFALDGETRAILLYVEAIADARKFMAAARAAARIKPVVVVKSGRHAQGARAAATHTGALAGSDAVYDAAFRRAGLLRVLDLRELFDAAETLGRVKAPVHKRLAILTNGGGVGVLAIDRLADLGGVAAEPSAATLAKLDAVLPPTWSRGNPIDIIGDADAARYAAALDILLADPDSDAILAMNVQTALAPAADLATAVAERVVAHRQTENPAKPVFAVWVGNDAAVSDTFNRAGIPHFETETEAVRGFMYLVRHREKLTALMECPPSVPEEFTADTAAARRAVEAALADGRQWLDPLEVVEVFRAYAIPIVPTLLAADPEEAARLAATLLAGGGTVAVKIFSRDIVHKSDVGGVRLNLTSAEAVRAAAADIIASARRARPDAGIAGVTLQQMIVRPKARELIAGIADDATFGPVLVFGQGGVAVEVIDDKALALPPLDLKLAHDLIARTRVSRLLKAYRNIPAARTDDVALMLVKLAQLAADIPEIRDLDINPLLADETGVLALDARIAVAKVAAGQKGRGHPRFAVRPYPKEWERRIVVGTDWHILVRPVRPEDEPMFLAFFGRVSADDLRLRFFAPIKDFSHVFIARLTQIDYDRAMAFVALDETSGEMLGAVRLHADADHRTGEYAILLRSDLKGRGLGWALMELIIDYARADGLRRIEGQVLRDNTVMLGMCRKLGFHVETDTLDGNIMNVGLPLAAGA